MEEEDDDSASWALVASCADVDLRTGRRSSPSFPIRSFVGLAVISLSEIALIVGSTFVSSGSLFSLIDWIVSIGIGSSC